MAVEADRVARGKRFQQIQEAVGDDNNAFADRLNAVAEDLGLEQTWHSVRVSKVRTGVQDLSLDDAAVLEAVDPEGRGWHWIAFGVEQLTRKRGAKPVPPSKVRPAPTSADRKGKRAS